MMGGVTMTSRPVEGPLDLDALTAEAAALDESNGRRLAEINARGKFVSGIDTNLLECMVALLLPPEAVALAHLNHQRWLAATLDDIESNLRKQAITAPLQGV